MSENVSRGRRGARCGNSRGTGELETSTKADSIDNVKNIKVQQPKEPQPIREPQRQVNRVNQVKQEPVNVYQEIKGTYKEPETQTNIDSISYHVEDDADELKYSLRQMSERLQEVYMEIADASSYKEDEDLSNLINNIPDVEEEVKKPSKKKIIIPLVVGGVVVIGLVVGGMYYLKEGNYATSIDKVHNTIDRMYTNKDKSNIKGTVSQKDLEPLYDSLLKMQEKGKDVLDELSELDTIGYYIADVSNLDGYLDKSFDITTPGMLDNVEDIVQNTKDYSETGLAMSISDKADTISDEYNDFIQLRQELQGITDVESFDETLYKDKINAVTHNPNREELEAIVEKLLVDKQAVLAQKEVDAAESEEAKLQAQEELQKAQELQKETQENLDAVKKKLEETALELQKKKDESSLIRGTAQETNDNEKDKPKEKVREKSTDDNESNDESKENSESLNSLEEELE